MIDWSYKEHLNMCQMLMGEFLRYEGKETGKQQVLIINANMQATLAIAKQLETTNELLTRIVTHLDNAEMLNS